MLIRKNLDTILADFNDRTAFNADTPREADVFISTMGFEEDRSAALFKSMVESHRLKNAICIIIEYPTNTDDNEKAKPLFEKCRKNVKSLEYIPYAREKIGEEISAIIPAKTKHIVVDISTMSSYVFYPLFYKLINSFGPSSLSVIYAEAKVYQPTFEEWIDFIKEIKKKKAEAKDIFEDWEIKYFQTTEIDTIYSSDIMSGTNPDPLPERLIAIPNFASVRMRTFCNHLRDNPISNKNHIWIFGRPPGTDKKWRLKALRELYKEFYQLNEIYEACTIDYKDIWLRLENIWEKEHLDYHLNVATLGSKMQHLGTLFFLLMHKEITLLLSEPKEYIAKSYSEGLGSAWVISLGNIDRLKMGIDSYNTIECNWENGS